MIVPFKFLLLISVPGYYDETVSNATSVHASVAGHKTSNGNRAIATTTKLPVFYEHTWASKRLATKMARLLAVSLDWLLGNTHNESKTIVIIRIQDVNKLAQKIPLSQ